MTLGTSSCMPGFPCDETTAITPRPQPSKQGAPWSQFTFGALEDNSHTSDKTPKLRELDTSARNVFTAKKPTVSKASDVMAPVRS
jgi:hypothetical protein